MVVGLVEMRVWSLAEMMAARKVHCWVAMKVEQKAAELADLMVVVKAET